MSNILLVVAAGLSTRFDGKPKHLAEVKGKTVLENTLVLARKWYDAIYVALNCQANPSVVKSTISIASSYGSNIVLIPSGKGDADAVYRALLKTGIDSGNVSVCWGDAWFKNSSVFETASEAVKSSMSGITFEAFCAVEDHPYGWFELGDDSKTIKRATFVNDRSVAAAKVGTIHDQCFFNINVKNFKQLFEVYERSIICEKTDIENNIGSNFSSLYKFKLEYEVSWYKMINWALYGKHSNSSLYENVSVVNMLLQPCAMSFNTEEDLMEIEKNV